MYRNGLVAQLVRALACHARGRGFEPHPSRQFRKISADLAHLVERHLAKVEVAGSSPVIRSKLKDCFSAILFYFVKGYASVRPFERIRGIITRQCSFGEHRVRLPCQVA